MNSKVLVMATYSDSELESMLSDLESDLVERKESWRGEAPEKGRQAVCAFANDLPDHRRPGVLFVGVDDNGVPSNLPITDELLQTLADIKSDGQTLPQPSLTVEKRRLRGCDVAVVTVLPAIAPPVAYRGRIWIRVGPRRGIASPQDERILDERRRYRDLPFDIQPVESCSMEALNRLAFLEEYLPNAFAPDIIAANERTYEQRLSVCRMIAAANNTTPTILGLLVIGKSPRDWLPGSYIQFLRIRGKHLTDPIEDAADLDGPVTQILRRVDEKLESHNRSAVDLSTGDKEIRTQPYPRVALQQITRNAVMHRTYENTNAPIRITWFDDRIEIQSPGGPYGIVTPETFGHPGVTDYRNPHLAEALRVLGFVQRFGVGIATAQLELSKNGNPPAEFDVNQNSVLVTIRKAP